MNSREIDESEAFYTRALDALRSARLGEAAELVRVLEKRGYLPGMALRANLLVLEGERGTALRLIEHLSRHLEQEDQDAFRVRCMASAGLFSELDELLQDAADDEMLGVAADQCLAQGDRSRGRDYALRLARENHDEHGAFWYIREADSVYTETARMLKLLVRGEFKLNGRPTFVQYHVAADTSEEALRYVREVEPMLPHLELVEVISEAPAPHLPHGVYWRSPWISGGRAERPGVG